MPFHQLTTEQHPGSYDAVFQEISRCRPPGPGLMFLPVPITLGRMERTLTQVGQFVVQRRNELHLDAAGLARAADVDSKTLASLEKGERWPRDRSRCRIEQALNWNTGSLSAIRAGGTPSVSGVIRDRSGRAITSWTAIENAEQEELELYRLAYIVADSRDLVRSQKSPLMTALTALLDEATELILRRLAHWRSGKDEITANDIEDARWFLEETRAANTIRRQGDIYVIEKGDLLLDNPESRFSQRLDDAAVAGLQPEVDHSENGTE